MAKTGDYSLLSQCLTLPLANTLGIDDGDDQNPDHFEFTNFAESTLGRPTSAVPFAYSPCSSVDGAGDMLTPPTDGEFDPDLPFDEALDSTQLAEQDVATAMVPLLTSRSISPPQDVFQGDDTGATAPTPVHVSQATSDTSILPKAIPGGAFDEPESFNHHAHNALSEHSSDIQAIESLSVPSFPEGVNSIGQPPDTAKPEVEGITIEEDSNMTDTDILRCLENGERPFSEVKAIEHFKDPKLKRKYFMVLLQWSPVVIEDTQLTEKRIDGGVVTSLGNGKSQIQWEPLWVSLVDNMNVIEWIGAWDALICWQKSLHAPKKRKRGGQESIRARKKRRHETQLATQVFEKECRRLIEKKRIMLKQIELIDLT